MRMQSLGPKSSFEHPRIGIFVGSGGVVSLVGVGLLRGLGFRP